MWRMSICTSKHMLVQMPMQKFYAHVYRLHSRLCMSHPRSCCLSAGAELEDVREQLTATAREKRELQV